MLVSISPQALQTSAGAWAFRAVEEDPALATPERSQALAQEPTARPPSRISSHMGSQGCLHGLPALGGQLEPHPERRDPVFWMLQMLCGKFPEMVIHWWIIKRLLWQKCYARGCNLVFYMTLTLLLFSSSKSTSKILLLGREKVLFHHYSRLLKESQECFF